MTYAMEPTGKANVAGLGPSSFMSKPCLNAAVALCQVPLGYLHAAAQMSARQKKALSVKWTKLSFWDYKRLFVHKSPFGNFLVGSCWTFVGNAFRRLGL